MNQRPVKATPIVVTWAWMYKAKRNATCPCKSGMKFKTCCHGRKVIGY